MTTLFFTVRDSKNRRITEKIISKNYNIIKILFEKNCLCILIKINTLIN